MIQKSDVREDFLKFIQSIMQHNNVDSLNLTLLDLCDFDNLDLDVFIVDTPSPILKYNKLILLIIEKAKNSSIKKDVLDYIRSFLFTTIDKNLSADLLKIVKNWIISAIPLDDLNVYKSHCANSYITKLLNFLKIEDIPSIEETLQKIYEELSKIENKPAFSRFYAEYALFILRSCDIKHKDLDPSFFDLIQKSLTLKPENNTAAFLYLGYAYKNFPLQLSSSVNDSYNLAVQYLEKSSAAGSTVAEKYLKKVQEKLFPQNWLSLMNTDVNLQDFLEQLKNKSKVSFSLLLSGPYGCGQEEFARQFLNQLNISFEEFSIADYPIAGDNNIYQKLAKLDTINKAYIIKYVESVFDISKSSGLLPIRMTYLMQNKLKENRKPIIFIVEDLNKLNFNLQMSFMFRIAFTYMDQPQKDAAYNLFFHKNPPIELDCLNCVTLDDFIRAKRKVMLFNLMNDHNKILEILTDEVGLKSNDGAYSAIIDNFSTELINSNINLWNLTDKLISLKQSRFTMLIYGPPGTGKSYYLRYLAHKLGINTLEKTAADLFSPYQGEPARKVAAMFAEAEQKKAMIILDEADEILKKRSDAERNEHWKVDMINAFLTQLDKAKYPLVCTTNFFEKIDPAILRRFVFKLKFNYLTPEQCQIAYHNFFKRNAPKELSNINNLTNGDFATVKSQSILLDFSNDDEQILKALRNEISAKSGVSYIATSEFDKNAVNTDFDQLNLIENKFKEFDNMKIVIGGPFGSGRMSFAQHLALSVKRNYIIVNDEDIECKNTIDKDKVDEFFLKATDLNAVIIFNNLKLFAPKYKTNVFSIKQTLEKVSGEAANFDAYFIQKIKNYQYSVIVITEKSHLLLQNDNTRYSFNFFIDFKYLNIKQVRYLYKKSFGFNLPFYFGSGSCKYITPQLFQNIDANINALGFSNNQKQVYRYFIDALSINKSIYLRRYLAKFCLFVLSLAGLIYMIRNLMFLLNN